MQQENGPPLEGRVAFAQQTTGEVATRTNLPQQMRMERFSPRGASSFAYGGKGTKTPPGFAWDEIGHYVPAAVGISFLCTTLMVQGRAVRARGRPKAAPTTNLKVCTIVGGGR